MDDQDTVEVLIHLNVTVPVSALPKVDDDMVGTPDHSADLATACREYIIDSLREWTDYVVLAEVL